MVEFAGKGRFVIRALEELNIRFDVNSVRRLACSVLKYRVPCPKLDAHKLYNTFVPNKSK